MNEVLWSILKATEISDGCLEVVSSEYSCLNISLENNFLCTLLLLHTNFQIFTTQMKIFCYSFPQHSTIITTKFYVCVVWLSLSLFNGVFVSVFWNRRRSKYFHDNDLKLWYLDFWIDFRLFSRSRKKFIIFKNIFSIHSHDCID